MQDQQSGKIIAKGPKVGRLFPIQFSLPPSLSLPLVSRNSVIVDYQVWHKHLGHPNADVLHDLLKYIFLGNKHILSLNSVHFDYIPCKLGKSKILPFPTDQSNVTQLFDIIHNIVWGMTPVISHANYKYFITFIDDYSRFTSVYYLRSKDEVFFTFKFFHAYVQTQFSSQIKMLCYDNGGEYMSHSFQEYLSQRSCPSTPQQNGVAKRKNRHLLDVVPPFC